MQWSKSIPLDPDTNEIKCKPLATSHSIKNK